MNPRLGSACHLIVYAFMQQCDDVETIYQSILNLPKKMKTLFIYFWKLEKVYKNKRQEEAVTMNTSGDSSRLNINEGQHSLNINKA